MVDQKKYHPEWTTISRYIRNLFHNRCARCNVKHDSKHLEKRLQVHHIDQNPQNNQFENLIPLCAKCHLQIEKESRVHASSTHCQLELFQNLNYSEAMQQLRKTVLEKTNGSAIQFQKELHYEQYSEEWQAEHRDN